MFSPLSTMMNRLSRLGCRSGVGSGKHTSMVTCPDAFLSFSPFSFLNFTAKLKFMFFDMLGQNNRIPETPIKPFPMLFAAPIYGPASDMVEMTVSNFLYDNPKAGHPSSLEVWLGNIEPFATACIPCATPRPFHKHFSIHAGRTSSESFCRASKCID